MTLQDFKSKFLFNGNKSLLVGIERESFLAKMDGRIAPLASKILPLINKNDDARFGFELSACQLEDRVGPCSLEEASKELLKNENIIKKAEKQFDFKRLNNFEVASDSMPLDVYPDPTGRYQQITLDMPKSVLLAACQIIGTHIHVGMPDHETALKVYNKVIKECDRLCLLGDNSNGKRLEIYQIVAPENKPSCYRDWEDFYRHAINYGFASDPRNCWHLIRISIHGTIEFRTFGATSNLNLVMDWVKECRDLCRDAM